MNQNSEKLADQHRSVAAIYEDPAIAGEYLDKRMQFSWQRLLHERQVKILANELSAYAAGRVLEVAPGPARLTVEMPKVARGTLVENSEEMIAIARARLKKAGLDSWEVLGGDAFKLTSTVAANEFDFAYTFRFLRHFRTPDREQLYSMLRQVLKPQGVLVFDVVGEVVYKQVEARNPQRAAGEIAVYDVTYTPESFAAEMRRNGFEVLKLHSVLRHFTPQSFISYKLDDVVAPAASLAVRALELLPSSTPLEWVAVCRKI